ncbi:hypothetical protein MCOR27_008253 [Pyricularia oryzae]|nr:hypothetical protein MCOR27_008253 [Pyricularia oryzae]KAI6288268.1 hypothetical protein MCOR26_000270 [Pyricularia oryzae]KAI6336693.1 hypothetical protein MCOR29_000072 [Pyricularia oryzae]KAI6337700.1 hypothetical protein MCOR30_003287 [Pyricularia oryzae]KAI6347813.1 hypothetical protein MCOR28_002160 [Pyricularia oryzae]
MAPSISKSSNMGQVIEYIENRLYLASYVNPPEADTLFPYPEPPTRSPTKRSRAAVEPTPVAARKQPYYFSIDDSLLYNAFHHDFGPLHIGHLYRFALEFHDILGAKENKDRPVVFWSRADPRSRANAACVLACYMVLIQSWPPHLALTPIAQVDPPLMPFRDAGYSTADYGITVQDVVYGVWKAKEEGCVMLDSFDLGEYEKYERVENGDFNWITPHFLAFASPMHYPVDRVTEAMGDAYKLLPKTIADVNKHPDLPDPFKNVLCHFSEKNIGLVVRLNSQLYSPSYFESLGIRHLDMIFEDGTCPPLSLVRKFIRLAHETITIRKRGIAVHCKAGLGRTGCLIGAYLIYRHGFTADEVISYMRFMRPGMVVGPQQHWLHLNQGVFREWWVEERVARKLRKELAAAAQNTANTGVPSTPIRAMQKASLGRTSATQASTPPSKSRTPLGEMDTESNTVGVQEDYLPAPTPGQPRKTGRNPSGRHHPYSRNDAGTKGEEQQHTSESISVHRSTNESDEEWHMRMARTSTRASPNEKKQRSASHTTTTTTTHHVYSSSSTYVDNDASNDIENIGSSVGRTKSVKEEARSSASGVLAKVRGVERSGSTRRAAASTTVGKEPTGIRKTSGRVASAHAGAVRKASGL